MFRKKRAEFAEKRVEKSLVSVLDNASRLQAPAVAKYVDSVRRSHPDETPAQIIERLEKLFRLSVTGSGTAVGAAAAVPGVGTVASIAALGAETVFVLEAASLLTLAVGAVHGIAPADHERRRALVLAVALGEGGTELIRRATGAGSLSGAMSGRLGSAQLGTLNNSLVRKYVQKYLAKRAAASVGKLLPAGIGAVIGGVANRALAKRIITNAREAFGPPPATFPTPALPAGSTAPAIEAPDADRT